MKPKASTAAGQTLIGMVLVVLILLAVGAYFLWGRTSEKPPSSDPSTIPKAALDRAQGVDCASHLQQLRAALQMAQMEGAQPPDLASLNLGPDFLKCPVGGEPYRYDPRTGQVNCPHPGHNRY